ncbi:MAG: response regulator [Pirellulales bacterium]|nr:response regulator [Pirellulales bacterium]
MSPKTTVYVVDDDRAMVSSLTSLIEIFGFDVKEFTSAEDFLAAYTPSGPACLVVDMRLPRMSGLELVRELASQGKPLPAIFITGDADAGSMAEANEQGAVGLLEKPFRSQELRDSIHAALAQNGSRPGKPLPR